MQDETRRLLSSLLSVGIAVISDIPRKEGECTRFSDSLSFSRRTEWGVNFNVRSAPDIQPATPNGDQNAAKKEDLAYTAYAIGMHVDSPYRSPPPAYQLLHAIGFLFFVFCFLFFVFCFLFFVFCFLFFVFCFLFFVFCFLFFVFCFLFFVFCFLFFVFCFLF